MVHLMKAVQTSLWEYLTILSLGTQQLAVAPISQPAVAVSNSHGVAALRYDMAALPGLIARASPHNRLCNHGMRHHYQQNGSGTETSV